MFGDRMEADTFDFKANLQFIKKPFQIYPIYNLQQIPL